MGVGSKPIKPMRNPLDILTKFKQVSVCCGADMSKDGWICSKCNSIAKYEEVLIEDKKEIKKRTTKLNHLLKRKASII